MHMGEGVLPAAACSAVCTSALYALRSRDCVATFKEIGAQGKTEISWRSWRGVMHKCKCLL